MAGFTVNLFLNWDRRHYVSVEGNLIPGEVAHINCLPEDAYPGSDSEVEVFAVYAQRGERERKLSEDAVERLRNDKRFMSSLKDAVQDYFDDEERF